MYAFELLHNMKLVFKHSFMINTFSTGSVVVLQNVCANNSHPIRIITLCSTKSNIHK